MGPVYTSPALSPFPGHMPGRFWSNHYCFAPKREKNRKKETKRHERGTFSFSRCISAENMPKRPKKTQKRTNVRARNVFLLSMAFCRKETKKRQKRTHAIFSWSRWISAETIPNRPKQTQKKNEHARAQCVLTRDVFLSKTDKKRQKRTHATFSWSESISAENMPHRTEKMQ